MPNNLTFLEKAVQKFYQNLENALFSIIKEDLIHGKTTVKELLDIIKETLTQLEK